MTDDMFEFVSEEKVGNQYVLTFSTTPEVVDELIAKYGENFEEVLSEFINNSIKDGTIEEILKRGLNDD